MLGLTLRLLGLDSNPISLFGDEVDVGYHAYSLLKTGRDYYGQFLPTYIHSLSEWRAPLLMYITIPSIAIFGLNEWGVRIPSVLFGSLSIIIMYLLTKLTTKNRRVALFAAFLLAITPWHIHYSRTGFEVSLLLFLILTGTYSLIEGLNNHKWLTVGSISFTLTLYTYSTAIVFTPLFILFVLFINLGKIKQIKVSRLFVPGIVFLAGLLPILFNIIWGQAALRFNQNSIFANPSTIEKIDKFRQEGKLLSFEKYFHNKPLSLGKNLLGNYFISFSPQFLFIDGDPIFRHSIHEMGELYWTFLPLILIGIIICIQKPRDHLVWFFWLLLSPLPASLTNDAAHATRLFIMVPPLVYFSSVGLVKIWNNRRLIGVLVICFLLIELSFYQERYWDHYRFESWRWWHMGYKEIMVSLNEIQDKYQRIFINNTYEPSLTRFLFWTKYDPHEFQDRFTSDKPTDNILDNFNGFTLGKIYFGTVKKNGTVPQFVKPGDLYLVSQRDEVGGDWDWRTTPPKEIKVIKTVTNPYDQPIFYLVTANGNK